MIDESACPQGSEVNRTRKVAILSGGRDKPYALGLAAALTAVGLEVDFIGGDEFAVPQLLNNPRVNYLNLRRDQEPAPLPRKMSRVAAYYWRLFAYALSAEPRIFHVLWNNKFEFFDRTLLMLYYKLLGKKIVFTAHNVNTRERDGQDSWHNRFSLRTQYRLADHIFLHTARMKKQLLEQFGVPAEKATVIPFGLNSTIPDTSLTAERAREQLGLQPEEKTILFFGNIAPYKGLEYLVAACTQLPEVNYRLLIVGYPKEGFEPYWAGIEKQLYETGVAKRTLKRSEYIPDEETEIYFKAADLLVLPYTHIFQSGVLFLGYNFGLPAIATDVGSLRGEIDEARAGLVAAPRDAADLAAKIREYFLSELYRELPGRREAIRSFARERYSWGTVAERTIDVYERLQGRGN